LQNPGDLFVPTLVCTYGGGKIVVACKRGKMSDFKKIEQLKIRYTYYIVTNNTGRLISTIA
jgi:hypothetical protein